MNAASLQLAFALGAMAAFASLARADAIGPPPTDCPEFSVAVDFCHGPPTCRIVSCSEDRDCAAGMRCEPRSLCVRQHCCSGRGCGVPETATFYTHVEGPCSSDGRCADDTTTCEARRVCVPGARTDAGRDGAGGCCAIAGRRGDGAFVVAALVVVLAALRRSRRLWRSRRL